MNLVKFEHSFKQTNLQMQFKQFEFLHKWYVEIHALYLKNVRTPKIQVHLGPSTFIYAHELLYDSVNNIYAWMDGHHKFIR